MVTVVLVTPRNPLNIGAAARAMSNFGFFDLRLVNAYRVAVDEARSGVNADSVLQDAREYSSVAEAVADCHLVVGTTALGPREVSLPFHGLEEAGRKLKRARGGVAILFGSEKFGLSNDDISHCHWLMRIPTRVEHRAMNLGQAVAVTLYELIRNGRAPATRAMVPSGATSGSEDRLLRYLLDSLTESGYVKAPVDASQTLKLRRLIRRLGLTEKDAVMWQGMLRQILWKLKQ
ncbi:MAG: RNA methyltransferase [Bryobacteraceae bacterium]